MSKEQRTPDELRQESELICEKLLGWERLAGAAWSVVWNDKTTRGQQWPRTPAFDTWADAGLILEALQNAGTAESYDALRALDATFYNCRLTPTAIRAVAVEYVRRLP